MGEVEVVEEMAGNNGNYRKKKKAIESLLRSGEIGEELKNYLEREDKLEDSKKLMSFFTFGGQVSLRNQVGDSNFEVLENVTLGEIKEVAREIGIESKNEELEIGEIPEGKNLEVKGEDNKKRVYDEVRDVENALEQVKNVKDLSLVFTYLYQHLIKLDNKYQEKIHSYARTIDKKLSDDEEREEAMLVKKRSFLATLRRLTSACYDFINMAFSTKYDKKDGNETVIRYLKLAEENMKNLNDIPDKTRELDDTKRIIKRAFGELDKFRKELLTETQVSEEEE